MYFVLNTCSKYKGKAKIELKIKTGVCLNHTECGYAKINAVLKEQLDQRKHSKENKNKNKKKQEKLVAAASDQGNTVIYSPGQIYTLGVYLQQLIVIRLSRLKQAFSLAQISE